MLASFKRLLAPNMVSRSIRHYQKVKPLNKEERLKLLEDRRAEDLFNALVLALNRRTSLSVDEWKAFRTKTKMQRLSQGNHAILTAIKSLDISQNPLKIAESFIEAFNIERNVIVDRIFIDLYAAKAARKKLTQSEEEELNKLCNGLVESEMYMLPEITGCVVNGFCATKDWKRALELSTVQKEPISLNLLIRKAMRENEYKIVWELLETLTFHHPNELQQKTIERYFHFVAKKNTPTVEHVEKMLRLLEKTEKILIEPTAITLIDILNRSKCGAKRIQMNFSGTCPNCEKSLSKSSITEDDFKLVRENFEKKVVHGVDLYHKTTPDEWNAFMKLIKENGPFDIVVDGLNVAFKSNYGSIEQSIEKPRANYDLLTDVVKQLKRDGKRVLVIGRKHMEKQHRLQNLYRTTRNVFLVDNISKDDIFLLYGAMHSGPNAQILSNDYMRNHKWAMGQKLEALFKKWQQQSTIGFVFDRNNHFNTIVPMEFKLFCHQNDGQWHIPFIGNEERSQFNNYALPKHWVCLRL